MMIINLNFSLTKFPFQSNANFTDLKFPSGILCHKNCVCCHFKWGDRICLIHINALLAFIHSKRRLGVESMSNSQMLSACWGKKWRFSDMKFVEHLKSTFPYYESHNNLDISPKWWWIKWRQTFFYVFLYFFQWKTHLFPSYLSFFSCHSNLEKNRIQNQL